jgi:hypothetical protein
MTHVVAKAQSDVFNELLSKLDLDNNQNILPTPSNQRALRQMDRMFRQAMDGAGYRRLTGAFVRQFDGQLPYFTETVEALATQIKTPLNVEWTKKDWAAFDSYKPTTAESLTAITEKAAARALEQTTFMFGTMPMRQITETIARQFAISVRDAEAIGSTAMSSYYRTITARGFDMIAEDLPEMELRFLYEGPLDNITRKWCSKIMRRPRNGVRWTKEQILKMDRQEDRGKSQPRNAFITAGGYNCRHQWVLAPPPKR